MSILLKTEDRLILRDGHPFGDIGIIGGYCRTWPLSQTLAGMVRTKIGFSKSENYFEESENCKKILNYGIKHQIPVLENGTFLAPVPNDIIFTQNKTTNKLTANILSLNLPDDSYGTDIPNKDWMIPYLNLKDKPVAAKPFFLYWDIFIKYLKEDLNSKSGDFHYFGTSAPISDFRIHNAVNPKTLTSNTGQLFSNKSIYLKVKTETDKTESVSILFNIEDNSEQIDISGEAYLGGERKTVTLEKSTLLFPPCPQLFENKKYLKLILATHGDFGNWCPEWLMPDLEHDTIEWTTIPGTDYNVRLRSAYINTFESISGWDYASQKPKATKKLVSPGGVYIIELKDPAKSKNIAEQFWGKFLDSENKESSLNGYGQLFVGNIIIK